MKKTKTIVNTRKEEAAKYSASPEEQQVTVGNAKLMSWVKVHCWPITAQFPQSGPATYNVALSLQHTQL